VLGKADEAVQGTFALPLVIQRRFKTVKREELTVRVLTRTPSTAKAIVQSDLETAELG
jgi:hypothetical protein